MTAWVWVRSTVETVEAPTGAGGGATAPAVLHGLSGASLAGGLPSAVANPRADWMRASTWPGWMAGWSFGFGGDGAMVGGAGGWVGGWVAVVAMRWQQGGGGGACQSVEAAQVGDMGASMRMTSPAVGFVSDPANEDDTVDEVLTQGRRAATSSAVLVSFECPERLAAQPWASNGPPTVLEPGGTMSFGLVLVVVVVRADTRALGLPAAELIVHESLC